MSDVGTPQLLNIVSKPGPYLQPETAEEADDQLDYLSNQVGSFFDSLRQNDNKTAVAEWIKIGIQFGKAAAMMDPPPHPSRTRYSMMHLLSQAYNKLEEADKIRDPKVIPDSSKFVKTIQSATNNVIDQFRDGFSYLESFENAKIRLSEIDTTSVMRFNSLTRNVTAPGIYDQFIYPKEKLPNLLRTLDFKNLAHPWDSGRSADNIGLFPENAAHRPAIKELLSLIGPVYDTDHINAEDVWADVLIMTHRHRQRFTVDTSFEPDGGHVDSAYGHKIVQMALLFRPDDLGSAPPSFSDARTRNTPTEVTGTTVRSFERLPGLHVVTHAAPTELVSPVEGVHSQDVPHSEGAYYVRITLRIKPTIWDRGSDPITEAELAHRLCPADNHAGSVLGPRFGEMSTVHRLFRDVLLRNSGPPESLNVPDTSVMLPASHMLFQVWNLMGIKNEPNTCPIPEESYSDWAWNLAEREVKKRQEKPHWVRNIAKLMQGF